jgi:hypothetical protein
MENEERPEGDGGSTRDIVDEALRRARQKALACRSVLYTFRLDAAEASGALATGWEEIARGARALSGMGGAVGSNPDLDDRASRLGALADDQLAIVRAQLEAYVAGRTAVLSRKEILGSYETLLDAVLALRGLRRAHLDTGTERRRRRAVQALAIVSAVCFLGLVGVGIAISMSIPAYDQGLKGSYYTKLGWKGHRFQRIDHTVDFDWGSGSPMRGVPSDRFSVSWEGCIIVDDELAGKMTLAAGGDDIVRVKLDGKKVIDIKGTQGYRVQRGGEPLVRGLHHVRVEFGERRQKARVMLGWARNGGEVEPIPARFLVPNTSRDYTCAPGRMKPLPGRGQR